MTISVLHYPLGLDEGALVYFSAYLMKCLWLQCSRLKADTHANKVMSLLMWMIQRVILMCAGFFFPKALNTFGKCLCRSASSRTSVHLHSCHALITEHEDDKVKRLPADCHAVCSQGQHCSVFVRIKHNETRCVKSLREMNCV